MRRSQPEKPSHGDRIAMVLGFVDVAMLAHRTRYSW